MTPPSVSMKVDDWQPGELLYIIGYRPSPKVLRIVADAIAEDVKEHDPVTIDVQLSVQIAGRVQPNS